MSNTVCQVMNKFWFIYIFYDASVKMHCPFNQNPSVSLMPSAVISEGRCCLPLPVNTDKLRAIDQKWATAFQPDFYLQRRLVWHKPLIIRLCKPTELLCFAIFHWTVTSCKQSQSPSIKNTGWTLLFWIILFNQLLISFFLLLFHGVQWQTAGLI